MPLWGRLGQPTDWDAALDHATEFLSTLSVAKARQLIELTGFDHKGLGDDLIVDYLELSLPSQAIQVRANVLEQVEHFQQHGTWKTLQADATESTNPDHITITSDLSEPEDAIMRDVDTDCTNPAPSPSYDYPHLNPDCSCESYLNDEWTDIDHIEFTTAKSGLPFDLDRLQSIRIPSHIEEINLSQSKLLDDVTFTCSVNGLQTPDDTPDFIRTRWCSLSGSTKSLDRQQSPCKGYDDGGELSEQMLDNTLHGNVDYQTETQQNNSISRPPTPDPPRIRTSFEQDLSHRSAADESAKATEPRPRAAERQEWRIPNHCTVMLATLEQAPLGASVDGPSEATMPVHGVTVEEECNRTHMGRQAPVKVRTSEYMMGLSDGNTYAHTKQTQTNVTSIHNTPIEDSQDPFLSSDLEALLEQEQANSIARNGLFSFPEPDSIDDTCCGAKMDSDITDPVRDLQIDYTSKAGEAYHSQATDNTAMELDSTDPDPDSEPDLPPTNAHEQGPPARLHPRIYRTHTYFKPSALTASDSTPPTFTYPAATTHPTLDDVEKVDMYDLLGQLPGHVDGTRIILSGVTKRMQDILDSNKALTAQMAEYKASQKALEARIALLER